MKKLIIAGSGIKFLSHLSYETQSAIKGSDFVLYLLNEPAIKKWISENAKLSLSLDSEYFSSIKRKDSYLAIEKAVVEKLDLYESVCFIVYGNPLFFSTSALNLAKNISRKEVNVEVIPAISALDCLFVDLRVDPAINGFQSYEATSFVLSEQMFNTDSSLILWQIGVVGITKVLHGKNELNSSHQCFLNLLVKHLLKFYDKCQVCYLYVAAQYPGVTPDIKKVLVSELLGTSINRLATLYIPPATKKNIKKELIDLLD